MTAGAEQPRQRFRLVLEVKPGRQIHFRTRAIMKALTVAQPWAWAIMSGLKAIENRTWQTPYRGRLAIHAGKGRRYLPAGYPRKASDPRDPLASLFAELPGLPALDDLVFGAIIGTVDLIDCCEYAAVCSEPFAEGPYCWLLRDPQPLAQPIPYKGQLGLFDVALELLKGV